MQRAANGTSRFSVASGSNGNTWSSVATGTTNVLHGVWGSGATDVWATGDSGTILHRRGSP